MKVIRCISIDEEIDRMLRENKMLNVSALIETLLTKYFEAKKVE